MAISWIVIGAISSMGAGERMESVKRFPQTWSIPSRLIVASFRSRSSLIYRPAISYRDRRSSVQNDFKKPRSISGFVSLMAAFATLRRRREWPPQGIRMAFTRTLCLA